MHPALQVLLAIVSVMGSVIGGLILFYLRTNRRDLDKIDIRVIALGDNVKDIETSQERCKTNCYNTFVDKVDYIRNVTKQEEILKNIQTVVNKLAIASTFAEQLPQICEKITQAIVKELKT